MKKINENTKVTLTLAQLKKLVKEANESEFEIQHGNLVEYRGKGGDVVIPNSVTRINASAFADCVNLRSVVIPDSVTYIDFHAFSHCPNLRSITIPGSVQAIANWAFKGCKGLNSVTIEDGVESIGTEAFADCSKLVSVSIPDSVTELAPNAFSGCRQLKQPIAARIVRQQDPIEVSTGEEDAGQALMAFLQEKGFQWFVQNTKYDPEMILTVQSDEIPEGLDSPISDYDVGAEIGNETGTYPDDVLMEYFDSDEAPSDFDNDRFINGRRMLPFKRFLKLLWNAWFEG